MFLLTFVLLFLILCPTDPSAAAGTDRPSGSVAGKLIIITMEPCIIVKSRCDALDTQCSF